MSESKKIFVFCLALPALVAAMTAAKEAKAVTDIKTGTVSNSFSGSLSEGTQECTLVCGSSNSYSYTFDYKYNPPGGSDWVALGQGSVNKCQQIKVNFSAIGDWGNTLNKTCTEKTPEIPVVLVFGNVTNIMAICIPPTDILACSGQDDCLAKGTEYTLTPDTFGKGVQKVPADFVAQTEKSLTSSNPYMKCTNGICVSYTSGSFPLSATAPASSYFGQCRGYGTTVNTPETPMPAVTSGTSVNIVNRAPVPTVSFAKNPIAPNEEVNVTCDIVDPDECSDKIAKVKWTCTDSNGQSNNCLLWKEQTGVWNTGSAVQEMIASERSNPYRATAMFKAGVSGNYAVTCEAWDDDVENPLSGTGINGITVAQNCVADGICNINCPADPDCDYGVVSSKSSFCALLSDSGETTICDGKGSINYKAYFSDLEPQSYQWKCSKNGTVKTSTTPNVSCDYDQPGTYLPSLSIVSADGKETACVTQTSATVASDSKCKVEVRKAGSGDEYSSSVNIQSGDTIEAKIIRQCLKGGKVSWNITDETVNQVKVKINSGGDRPVQASITQDNGQTTVCGEADLSVKEKIQWGN
ncbi:MAG: hypothetical protein V1690_03215 [Candidatus Moraniibacteriota bacterium]